MSSIFESIAWLLAKYYSLVHSYAGAIALLTLTIMVIVLPLTLKGTKSMLETQKVQPLVKQIQQDFKNDPQGRNEAMMALYKEHKINPVGGCLPMLLQAPVFMILWRVLSHLTLKCTTKKVLEGKCTAEALDTFMPDYISKSSELYQNLVGQKEMLSFGLDLSKPAVQVIGENVLKGLPYLVLVLLVGLMSYYQNRQIMSRNTGAQSNKQQQMIMNLMPIFFGFISLTFASGLIVYLLVSNLVRIVQNYYITHRFYGDAAPAALLPAGIDKVVPAKPLPSKPLPAKPSPSKPSPSKPKPPPSKPNPPKPNPPNPPKPKSNGVSAGNGKKTTEVGGAASGSASQRPVRPQPPSKRSSDGRPQPKKKP